jgi:NAD(P)-dependent dehydrogenase (short-subunit alcohol dehydrogenase family)
LDVTHVLQIDAVVERIRKEMGEIDVLVCAAGIGPGAKAEDITEAEWDNIFAVNDKGLFFCNRAVAVQSMMPRKTGSIVNMASLTALIGFPPPMCSAHYHASKGGVARLTKAEAIEWASYNIRVNAVAPTAVSTPLINFALEVPEVKNMILNLIPLRRIAKPEDIAAVVCFLTSNYANVITGVVLPVDGGQTAG